MDTRPAIKSSRAFIGAKDYTTSKSFYRELGFAEKLITEKLSLFTMDGVSFYLQDYYVKDWIDNTMMLLEVDNVDRFWAFLLHLELDQKFKDIKLIPIQQNDWGKECLLIDPSGVLWHFAEFR